MATHSVTIAGRSYELACEDGQEPSLEAAAALLDKEAATLTASAGRMPEARLMLFTALVLADRLNCVQSDMRALQKDYNKLRNMRALEAEGLEAGESVPNFVLEDMLHVAAQIEAATQSLSTTEAKS